MECTEWQKLGLLYVTGELNRRYRNEYEAHIGLCQACREDLELYRREHEGLFTVDALGEAPSSATDAEILRVCSSSPRQRTTFSTLFPAIVRKSLLPLSLFLIGFVSVGYVMLHKENARMLRTAETSVVAPVEQALADSLPDGSADSARYPRPRGNLNEEGVVTVDLQEK